MNFQIGTCTSSNMAGKVHYWHNNQSVHNWVAFGAIFQRNTYTEIAQTLKAMPKGHK